jgi:tRNA (guanine-N7-)-methyltransferase
MSRQKLKRFADNHLATNVIQPEKQEFDQMIGRWNSHFFQNTQPIVVELACGRGEYAVGLAKVFPEHNFVGVDIKGNRIWVGSRQAQEANLKNVGFLRTRIQNLEHFFAPQEIAEIWITFPDPRPKGRDEKRRLTNPRFLAMYQKLVAKDGWVHLKTDNQGLFEYTLEVLQQMPIRDLAVTHDLYASPFANDHKGIKTKFEQIYLDLGQVIYYLKFRFTDTPIVLDTDFLPFDEIPDNDEGHDDN